MEYIFIWNDCMKVKVDRNKYELSWILFSLFWMISSGIVSCSEILITLNYLLVLSAIFWYLFGKIHTNDKFQENKLYKLFSCFPKLKYLDVSISVHMVMHLFIFLVDVLEMASLLVIVIGC